MGVEERWQDRVPRRMPAWRGRDDRNGRVQRRSRWMLIAGSALLLVAMMLARWLPHGPGRGAARPAIPMAPAVVAVAPIGFGEKLTPDKLKLVDVPAQQLPKGHFGRIDPLILGQGRTAVRPIAANEIIMETALVAGATRLSTAPLLGPTMRAVAVQVNEVAGVSGLVFPGDRVDLFLVRQPDEAMPHADLLAQNIRVLAVGSDMNIARDKPGVVKTVTLEVSPLLAQKLPLAMATGEIRLALRPFGNEARVRLESLQVSDLNDGTTTRLVRKPGSAPATATTRPAAASQRRAPSVIVMRGGTASAADVLP
jgi:pilus assembly protein CpaB